MDLRCIEELGPDLIFVFDLVFHVIKNIFEQLNYFGCLTHLVTVYLTGEAHGAAEAGIPGDLGSDLCAVVYASHQVPGVRPLSEQRLPANSGKQLL